VRKRKKTHERNEETKMIQVKKDKINKERKRNISKGREK
jgi:hypothetical protein